jgi:Cell Wall Hydrolase
MAGYGRWAWKPDTPPIRHRPEVSARFAPKAPVVSLAPPTSVFPPAQPFVLEASPADRARAEHCLAQAVYFEAGDQSEQGQAAVAQTVLNRVRHPDFPKSICGVVYQGARLTTGCQYSFTCDGALARSPDTAGWTRALAVARRALSGYVEPEIGWATHYHAVYVTPYWQSGLIKLTQIGAHIFYRWPGLAGAPEAFVGRYAGHENDLPPAILSEGDPPALVAAVDAARPPPRTVELAFGGETERYIVNAPGAPPVAGALTPSRPHPTPAQVAEINAQLSSAAGEDKPSPQRDTP